MININKNIFLTFDLDWASDEILEFLYELICKYNINVTLNVTNDTKMLEVFRKDERIELGIHPNFNNILDGKCNDGKDKIIRDVMLIVPEANTVRSHSLVSSSQITGVFREYGLKYELNKYIPIQKGACLAPWKLNDVLQIPFIFEDDFYMMENIPYLPTRYLDNDFEMFRVFNFHPIHLFLNCEKIDRYTDAKKYYKDYYQLKSYVNHDRGMRTFFERLLSEAMEKGYLFKCISEFEQLKK